MRVLYFHQYYSTPDGFGGTRPYAFARHLVDRGHQVTMVCGNIMNSSSTGLSGDFHQGCRKGEVDGIRIIEFNLTFSNKYGFFKRSVQFLRFALRSMKVALTEEYDLIFASSTPLTVGLPGIAARMIRRKPFVFEVRDLWPELPREMGVISNPVILKAMDLLEWASYRTANLCIGLSPGIVQGITRRGVDLSRVVMIPNGCDLDLFTPGKTGARRPEAVASTDFVAIFSGAHGIANGLDAVLDAAAELRRRGRSDIKLLFVGDGKMKPDLIRRARDEGLENCIFLDSVPKRELVRLQKGADVGLMILANVPAFYYGTSPNKFFDYISSGLPVLNNYPGWLAELIRENNCGIAVSPENPVAFADALEEMAANRELLQEMGENARAMAERVFDRKNLAKTFLESLEGQVPAESKLKSPEKAI